MLTLIELLEDNKAIRITDEQSCFIRPDKSDYLQKITEKYGKVKVTVAQYGVSVFLNEIHELETLLLRYKRLLVEVDDE